MEAARACGVSLPGRRAFVGLVLVLALMVLHAWMVLLGYTLDVLYVRPQVTHSSLRREDTVAFTGRFESTPARLLELGNAVVTDLDGSVYPEAIYAVEWSTQVARQDVLHLGALQRACTTHGESVIPWEFGRMESQEPWQDTLLNRTMDNETLLAKLKECPPIDVYIPTGLRSQGYCEDAASYTKFLHARMLPRWVMEIELFDKQLNRSVTYHELCPRTPLLFFSHYWDGLRDRVDWPNTKPLYLMPNIEMYELEAQHYWQVDVILCKTAICTQYLNKWYDQEGNPRMTQVLYTRFTTSDMATNALVAAGVESADAEWVERDKDYKTPVFIHTAGSSSQKGTRPVLDCWLARPDLPQLELYIGKDNYNGLKRDYDKRIRNSPNVKLHSGGMDAIPFGEMIAHAAFILCTSVMEGYGHYINHARASGGLIVTPNVPPMNELVTPSSGVMLKARRGRHQQQFLGGDSPLAYSLRGVEGYVANFGDNEVCAAVDEMVKNVSATERRRRAHRVRQQYFYNTAFFATKMEQLRKRLGVKE